METTGAITSIMDADDIVVELVQVLARGAEPLEGDHPLPPCLALGAHAVHEPGDHHLHLQQR